MSVRDDRPTTAPASWVTLALKRALDVVGSTLGLIMLSPMFPIVAIAIKRDSPGPIFFRQDRVGRDGRVFQIYKFRSMAVRAANGTALTLRADKRVTRVGAFLRRTKLDELPQLINVLSGDMSLVGPRPEVPEFMKFYSSEQSAIILSMRPGMTDYAAILFRDENSLFGPDDDPVTLYRHKIMPIKFGYYERYSREIGLLNDLRIILATVLLLLAGHVPWWLGIESELKIAPVRSGNETRAKTYPSSRMPRLNRARCPILLASKSRQRWNSRSRQAQRLNRSLFPRTRNVGSRSTGSHLRRRLPPRSDAGGG